jgi:hypothetical protein
MGRPHGLGAAVLESLETHQSSFATLGHHHPLLRGHSQRPTTTSTRIPDNNQTHIHNAVFREGLVTPPAP